MWIFSRGYKFYFDSVPAWKWCCFAVRKKKSNKNDNNVVFQVSHIFPIRRNGAWDGWLEILILFPYLLYSRVSYLNTKFFLVVFNTLCLMKIWFNRINIVIKCRVSWRVLDVWNEMEVDVLFSVNRFIVEKSL